MDKIANITFAFSLSYLFAFPIFLVLIKFASQKELVFRGKKVVESILSIIALAIFSFSNEFLTDGGTAPYFILIWFILLIPTAIGFYVFIDGLNYHCEKEYTGKKKTILGFSYRTALILASSIIFTFSFVVYFTISNCKAVLDYHYKLVNEIVNSENPKELLYEETSQPSYMFDDIITDIELIKDNKANIKFALPWSVEVIVGTPDRSEYWELGYVRNNDSWRLEGLLSKVETLK